MSEAMQFPGMDQQQPQKGPSFLEKITKNVGEGISGFLGKMVGLQNEAKGNMTPDAPKPSNPFATIGGKMKAWMNQFNSFWK
jgi:hypothetical protein